MHLKKKICNTWLVINDVISMVNNMTSMGIVQSAAKVLTKLNKERLP